MQTDQTKIKNKAHLRCELEKFGIKIKLSRSVGYNSFNLIYESYNTFCINADENTTFETSRKFTDKFTNVNILLNN
jgi:hypothetical protein